MIDIQNLEWHPLTKVDDVPQLVLDWLVDDLSLTAKLKEKFSDFSVRVIEQSIRTPFANESDAIDFNHNAVIREVELIGDGSVVVFARSVIPQTPDTEELLRIGSRPLGEVLFNDSSIQRGQLEVTQAQGIWGRRSIFYVGKTKLLVCEFFFEALYA